MHHDVSAIDILDSVAAHVAVITPDGRISQVNRAWERFSRENSPGGVVSSTCGIGADYLGLCRGATGDRSEEAMPAALGIEGVLNGKLPAFTIEYPCDSPTEPRWFAMHVTPLSGHGRGAVVAHYDITARKQAELKVAAQSRQIELALSAAQMGVWSLDLKTRRIYWSREVHQVLGVENFDGTVDSWQRLVHPDDIGAMQVEFDTALERRLPFSAEFRVIRPDGAVRWVTNLARIECTPDGDPVAVVGTVEDITERRRSEWALTAYNHILELIATGADLHQTLLAVVALVEEQLPGTLCSVLIVDGAHERLRLGVAPSMPEAYNRGVDGVPIGPSAGSCGTAAHRGQTVVVTDIAHDPLWADYRDLALAHGLRSCVSVPIFSSGNVPGHERGSVIGTFALYRRDTGMPDPHTFTVLSGAEPLASRAIQTRASTDTAHPRPSQSVIEAAHLAGVAIERRQAEHAVRQGEARFRSVLDSSLSAVFLKDLDRRYLFVNRTMADLFDVPPEGWEGRRATEVLPTHLATACERMDERVLAATAAIREESDLALPDGRKVRVIGNHFTLNESDGRPYAICGVLTDITDLVSVRQELYRLWTHAPEPLCVAGFDGRFRQVNPAWTQCLGWSEAELLERTWPDLVHAEDRAACRAALERLTSGQVVHRLESRFQCADGTYRWLSWESIPLMADQTIYGFVRDVTEEKRLGEQFRQAQKMEAVGQLASGVAHDFNNLLTVINGSSEVLLEGTPAADPKHEMLGDIHTAGLRAAELTAQLLAFSRKAIIEPKVLAVNELVDSSARLIRRLIGEDVEFVTSLAPVPAVRIDPGQLEHVFMNLAVNARDAMPTGGRLTIATAAVDVPKAGAPPSDDLPAGQYVRISVTDTGGGMSPEVQARIFEPFFTTKGVGKGTGLGLATVYGILRQAGGAITVDTEVGRGTTFHLLLPAVLETPGRRESSAISAAPRGTETLLLAEDEPGVRDLARMLLTALGYTVLVAASGSDVLRVEAAYDGPIDLLVTDVVMPDLGGRALVDRIRARRPGTKVLYMSGYMDDAVIRHGVETSQDRFIQKPFSRLELALRVREALDGAS